MQNSTENSTENNKPHNISLSTQISHVIITIVILVFTLSLTGCESLSDVFEDVREKLRFRDEEEGFEINVASDAEPEFVITITDDEAEWNSFDNSYTLSDANALASIRIDELSSVINDYYYMMIPESEREVYDQIYDLLVNFKTDVILSTTDTDLIDHAFTCVLIDHPDIFYVKGYSIKTYTKDGKIEKIAMNGTYTMSRSRVAEMMPYLDRYYNECAVLIPAEADEYTKVKTVYEYIIKNTEYDLEAPDNQNVLSVFAVGRSVCQGYAKATQYILNRLGIFCTLVEGTVKDDEAHVWNLVRINGEYYHLDTTWGDASYKLISRDEDEDKELLNPPDINYDYLCITTEDVLLTHEIREVVPIMECDSINANYYVREGLYFTYVDDEGLSRAFKKAYENDENTVTIKCSDEKVYKDMTDYLLVNQKIFNYLEETSVNYVTVDEQKEIIIYL
ncbi:MAG: hypothetical protein K5770_05840 [Lachnospiraceae bacterium]|nr:hypothetical protein [Lachnospiraceae bacterium]